MTERPAGPPDRPVEATAPHPDPQPAAASGREPGTVPGVPDGAAPAVARTPARVDPALRAAGGVVAVALTVLTALAEIFYSPLRVGGVLIGASALVALLVNFWLLRFTVAVTGARWTALLPPLVWFALMMAGATRRDEGDILLAGGNWVGVLTIFTGSVAFAFAGYRMILPPR